MRIIFLIFFCVQHFGYAQIPERKIIIDKNKFYFTTIHDEFQIASLYIGDVENSINDALQLGVPAGRNYNVPVIPFSWDISDSVLYAVNFLNHPLNDRNEALKKIKLKNLKKSDEKNIVELLMQSTEMNTFVMNEPYMFMHKRNNELSNFYFDGIKINDSVYVMAICNNNEFMFWKYNGKYWKHSDVKSITISQSFSLLAFKKKIYMFINDGRVLEVSLTKLIDVSKKNKNIDFSKGVLVDNRDKKSIGFINYNDIDKTLPFEKLIDEKITKIL